MPKLPKKVAERVAEAEASSFEAFPEGVYIGTLKDVEVREGQKGPYWSWKFGDITDTKGKTYPGHLWVNTSLSENADWKMKEMYDAFGYSTDSDTDEMIGEKIKLAVSQRVIERGSRQGEIGNNVDRCMPLEGDESGDDDTF